MYSNSDSSSVDEDSETALFTSLHETAPSCALSSSTVSLSEGSEGGGVFISPIGRPLLPTRRAGLSSSS